ncbi:ABC transporter permease [Clostridium sp. Cult2]|uniref:ABC transporter permease n=1 Tax=Clostridium sp. Cult2 TaxID=2079003 RepID=UPI001F2AEE4D|nr:ABC transporter permease [Clostridium sp. Cult2]MCF6465005.1 peptide ABC transporter permease [Clostridium sp. Cult2]
MHKYILKRILMLIPVLIGVTFLVFFIMALRPGDPAVIILGDGATDEAVAQLRKELSLDDPLIVRYGKYMKDLLRGDMGVSYRNQLDVKEQVLDRFPNTVLLAVTGMVVALLIGIPVGILSAKKQYTLVDRISMVGALIGVSMPNFWFGLVVVMFFSLRLGLLPSSGMGEGFVEMLKSLVLPALTLGTGAAATVTRMTRSSMLEVIRQDYISTARSKGIKESQVTHRHMFKNALIPIITVVGLQFGYLLGGAVLTETVFSWPGLGRFMVEAIKTKDTPVVLGTVIFMSVVFSIVNLVVDILYAFVDPRIKSQYSTGKGVK